MQALEPGAVISYPAGSADLDPERFRLLSGPTRRMAEVFAAHPQLAGLLGSLPPLIVNCYPATLGVFPQAVQVDTYMRQPSFDRALALAAARGMTAILIGQPLALGELVAGAVHAGVHFPAALLIASGGYYLPTGLELFLTASSRASGCEQVAVLHAYGIAEVDFGVLTGIRGGGGELTYRLTAADVELRISDGMLELRRCGDTSWVASGDRAEMVNGGYRIRSGPERVCPAALAELESWRMDQWARYTGRIHIGTRGVTRQLRLSSLGPSMREATYYEFFDRYGGSPLDKPRWSFQAVAAPARLP
jgi:hypothetical protein